VTVQNASLSKGIGTTDVPDLVSVQVIMRKTGSDSIDKLDIHHLHCEIIRCFCYVKLTVNLVDTIYKYL